MEVWISSSSARHVEHHMRAKLAPLLYDDTDRETAARTEDGLPVQSFQSLLGDLAGC